MKWKPVTAVNNCNQIETKHHYLTTTCKGVYLVTLVYLVFLLL